MEHFNGEEIFGRFYKKQLQKTNQTEFRIETEIKEGEKLYLNWNGCGNWFSSWIDKKIYKFCIMSFYPKPHRYKIKAKLGLFNYAKEMKVKKVTDVGTSGFANGWYT